MGLRLGAYPTTFFVKEFSKRGILEAMEKGRMYCSFGKSQTWPRLDYFSVLGKEGEEAIMGETLVTSHFPVIKFRISYNSEKQKRMNIFLIRGGRLIHTFKSDTPIEVEYVDEEVPSGVKTYYRLFDSKNQLTSNPIFVLYDATSPR